MSHKDYYKILGLSKNASDAELKKQYRRLARKYHPDVSKLKNTEERFKEINEAYDVLKDKTKRSNYDRFGDPDGNPFKGGFTPPPGGNAQGGFGGFGTGESAQGGFGDFFEQIFSGSTRGSRFNTGYSQSDGYSQHHRPQQKGKDQTVNIYVKLEDAYHGANRSLNINIPGEPGEKKLKVKIPKGIKEHQKIRLTGQGGKGHRINGDLLLEVNFDKHRYFTVDGKDIILRLPIAPWEAALGTTLSIPTLGGHVDMKLPVNTQGGKKLRLKGRGLPGKETGDQYVILDIVTPAADSEKLRLLYEQLKQESGFDPRASF